MLRIGTRHLVTDADCLFGACRAQALFLPRCLGRDFHEGLSAYFVKSATWGVPCKGITVYLGGGAGGSDER